MAADTIAEEQWIKQMDDAVGEVFELMLQRICAAVDEASATKMTACISATISFSGALEGQCVVEVPSATAEKLTGAFLGSDDVPSDNHAWDDTMIEDSVGELCNMIAGGWKRKLGALASASDLSVPSISRGLAGLRYESTIGMRRTYAFDDAPFLVHLAIFQSTGA